MALEDLTGADKFIANLNPANPVGSDDKRDGDNHIRGIKNVLRNTFPNLNGAVTATDEELGSIGAKVSKGGDTMTGSLGIGIAPGVALDVIGEIRVNTNAPGPSVLRIRQAGVREWTIGQALNSSALRFTDTDGALDTLILGTGPAGGANVSGDITALRYVGYDQSAAVKLQIGHVVAGAVNGSATYRWNIGVSGNANGQSLAFTRVVRDLADAQAAMFDPAGNFIFAGASAQGRVTIYCNRGGGQHGLALHPGADAGAGNNVQFLNAAFSGVGSITTTASSTAFNTSSDVRLKTKIADAPSQLDRVDAIAVRSFEFKAEPGHAYLGFIAQELHAVVPDAVHVGGDDPKSYPWGIDASKLVPLLVKAIQELRAELQTVRDLAGV